MGRKFKKNRFFFLDKKGILDTRLIDSVVKRVEEKILSFSRISNLPLIQQAASRSVESLHRPPCSFNIIWKSLHSPSISNLPVIKQAASLAHHGLLDSVKYLVLGDGDLTSVPAEHLASLASSVTGCVDVRNVYGSGLVTFLDNVKSEQLVIRKQNLDSEESQALMRTMESRVKEVQLDKGVTLYTD